MPAEAIVRFTDEMGPRVVHFYALADEGGVTLFDTGLPGSVQSRLGGEIAGPVGRVIVSHADADHLGDAGAIPTAEILCHAEDRRWVEDHDALVQERYAPVYAAESLPGLRAACGPNFSVHRTLHDGETLRVGDHTWRVLHVPGHTRGHIALWRETDGVLLFGDSVLGLTVPGRNGAASMPPPHCYIREYLQTIEALSRLPVSMALSGHWPTLDGEAFRRLLADSRLCVERDLDWMTGFVAEPRTADACFVGLCAAFRCWPVEEDVHYRCAVAGYLEYLIEEAVLERLADGRFVAASA